MLDKKLNVLIFTGSMSWPGGTERTVSMISSYLADRAYNVYILSSFDGEASFYKLDPKVKLLSLHMEKYNIKLQYFNITMTLRKLLIQNQIDIIIYTDTILSLYTFPAIIGTNIKTIYQENFNYYTDLNSIKRKFSRKVTIKYADHIVTVSQADANNYKLARKQKGKVTTIYNVKPFKTDKKAHMEVKTVVTVGRLTRQKGYDLLLKAWKNVMQHEPKWKLQIIGTGIEEKNLKALAMKLALTDSVEFHGQSSSVQEYYENASMFVMSSRFEGFGIVLIEAKEFGLPIVSFDCPYGPGEIVRNQIDGLLAKPGNVEDLTEKLLMVMRDTELREKFSENALRDERFEKEKVLPKWEKVIHGLCD